VKQEKQTAASLALSGENPAQESSPSSQPVGRGTLRRWHYAARKEPTQDGVTLFQRGRLTKSVNLSLHIPSEITPSCSPGKFPHFHLA